MLSSTVATATHPLPWLRRLLRQIHRRRQIHRLQRLSNLHTVVSVQLFDQFRHLERRLSDPKIEWMRQPWPTSPSSMTSLISTVVSSTHQFSGLNFLGFFFRYFPPPPWPALSGFVGWLGHGGGWDCGLRLVVGRLFFSFFPLQHVDMYGRWSGGGWYCFDLLVVWGVSRVGVGWVLPICW